MDDSAAAPSSGETRKFIRRATLTVHYGDSLAVECTLVVHSFLRCIVGLNECTREHQLWFRTPLKMAVPSNSALFEGIGGDFGYSPCFPCHLNQTHLIQIISSLVETPRPELGVRQNRDAKCAVLGGLQEHGWEPLLYRSKKKNDCTTNTVL